MQSLLTTPYVVATEASVQGHFVLRVSGALPIDWAPRLTSGLARLDIDIVRGRAQRGGPDAWRVELVCHGAASRLPTPAVERILRGDTEVSGDPGLPPLSSFDLQATSSGELRLRVDAHDSLGFLGRLLRGVALFGLFPRQLSLDTHGARVEDVLVLGGIGIGGISDRTRNELERALRRATGAAA